MVPSRFQGPRIDGPVDRLLVVFGDQLDRACPVLVGLEPARDAVLLMEVREESTHVPSHPQRTAMFLSAMRHFALDLVRRGVRVEYVALDDPESTQSFTGEFVRAHARLSPEHIMVRRPGEWRVCRMLGEWERELGITIVRHEDARFLTTPGEFRAWVGQRKELVMEHFYRWQRKRLGVLVDEDGQPEGGAWNFDTDNREAFKKAPRVPAAWSPEPDAITREVIDLVGRSFPTHWGRLDASTFRWAVTPEDARRVLDDFIQHRLGKFGTYEDAMWTGEAFLYHSLLSPALNLGLISPRAFVDAAIAAYRSGKAPLNAVEGFVRQVIGWREFIRGVYWHEGEGYEQRNALDQHGKLPELYWTGETDMRCMRECVGSVLEHAYAHHIPRLMVMGNFAMLLGVHPKKVSDWYLAMFADGVDWVTLPNTLGMSQHADGGVVGTKPYAASGKYIQKMSNYCEQCVYDVKQRTGEKACPFNALYWDFLIRNEAALKKNHRMAMVMKNVERMGVEERVEIRVSAQRTREELGVGNVRRAHETHATNAGKAGISGAGAKSTRRVKSD